MKTFILGLLLICCGSRMVYSDSVQFIGEFGIYFPGNYDHDLWMPTLSLYYDQTSLNFEVRILAEGITVDDDQSWMKKPVKDTSWRDELVFPLPVAGTNALPRVSASPVHPPISDGRFPEPPKVCRFEYVGFEDTGGQVSNLTCHYGNYNSVSFKRNETASEIRGKVTISYNIVYLNEDGKISQLEGDRETRYARTFGFYYQQKPRIDLEPGKIPERLIVSLDTTRIEGTPARGGNNTYQYSWERWENDKWQEIAGASSRDYNAGKVNGDCRLRRKVTSGSQFAYTNVCLIRNWDFGNRNYVLRSRFLWSGGARPVDSATYDITYYDGLGRPEQLVNIKASPSGSDLITPFYYDPCGKSDTRTYLPYTASGNKGLYDASAYVRQPACYNTFYPGEGPFAYTEKKYTAAVSGRLEEERLAGKVYRDSNRKLTYTYSGNAASEVWQIQAEPDGGFRVAGYYPANTLHKVVAVDEDGKVKETFTDLFGRTVLERSRDSGNEKIDIYSVYDDFGYLHAVISPEGAALLSAGLLAGRSHRIADLYSYLYSYDGYGRVTVKKLPGIAEEYWVYDRENRPVMFQDGHLRLQKQWKLTAYDAMGRVTEESLVVRTDGRAELQRLFDSGNSAGIYASARTVLRQCRYDTYQLSDPAFKDVEHFIALVREKPGVTDIPDSEVGVGSQGSGNAGLPFSTALFPEGGFEEIVPAVVLWNSHPTGWKTWEKLAVLEDGDAVSSYIERVFYYDTEGRLIQTAEKNAGSWDRFTASGYDFTGKTIRNFSYVQTSASWGSGLLTEYVYDSRDRLLLQKSRFNWSGEGRIAYAYDELGRLRERTYGKDVCREELSYNLQGWLTSLSSPVFSMKLRYDSPLLEGSRASYTGNISEWEWQQGTTPVMAYSLAYDGYGRFSGARSFKNGICRNTFTEQNLTYDRNGNLRTLERTSGTGTTVDRLVYGYTGNRLTTLTENIPEGAEDVYRRGNTAAGSYTYDVNGNLQNDSRRGLNYHYNFLNLLDKAEGSGGREVSYSWVYPGEKRGVKDETGKGYGYWGNFLYSLNGSSLNLSSAFFDGGEFVCGMNTHAVYYRLSDHLGSVRAVMDSTGIVRERNDYYPLGMRHLRSEYPLFAGNRFKYNGKEEQTMGGLGFLDYGARMYDAGLGRWFVSDPLAETYYGLSPYAYCAGNPLSFVDPTGMWIDDYFTYFGKYLGHDDASSDLIRLIFEKDWNKNKYINSGGEETISHALGFKLSKSFSDIILTDGASLRIYDHYNFTGLPLKKQDSSGTKGGMTFHVGDSKFLSILIKIERNRDLKTADHANNIINMFVHENQHYKDYKQNGKAVHQRMDSEAKERRAINAQVYHESYPKTTGAFHRSVKKYMEKNGYVMPMSILSIPITGVSY